MACKLSVCTINSSGGSHLVWVVKLHSVVTIISYGISIVAFVVTAVDDDVEVMMLADSVYEYDYNIITGCKLGLSRSVVSSVLRNLQNWPQHRSA